MRCAMQSKARWSRPSRHRKNERGQDELLLRAQTDLNVDLASSILIGDKLSDIQAGGDGTHKFFFTTNSSTANAGTVSARLP
jgi:histidinol phosphatase-like enzyme